jgi:hypothetical protein
MTDRARILHWIVTRKNEFKTDYVRHEAADSTIIGLEGDQGPFAASASESLAHHQGSELTPLESSESENSSSHSQDELLVGWRPSMLARRIRNGLCADSLNL